MRMENTNLDDDTVSEFKEAFELLDEAKKGNIDKHDLKLAFKKYGVRVAEESLDEAFKVCRHLFFSYFFFQSFVFFCFSFFIIS